MLSFVGLNVATVCLWIVQASGFVAIPTTITGRNRHHHRGSEAFAHGGDVLGDAQKETCPDLKVLEFYSGIGGLRVSLQAVVEATSLEITAVGSYEINAVANSVRPRDERRDHTCSTHTSCTYVPPRVGCSAPGIWQMAIAVRHSSILSCEGSYFSPCVTCVSVPSYINLQSHNCCVPS